MTCSHLYHSPFHQRPRHYQTVTDGKVSLKKENKKQKSEVIKKNSHPLSPKIQKFASRIFNEEVFPKSSTGCWWCGVKSPCQDHSRPSPPFPHLHALNSSPSPFFRLNYFTGTECEFAR
ncbi:hypothetical protein AVEN_21740-1 [Araneus ventricosus]|uniref:Uncharacterized protein n=1 Tax=Araneus ventricosus TaxID=182803 RepID=A0A4Y2EX47_ARAVE|nr:hypothetical protein AVEN_21740-1 [Araneus ventricosus]